MPLQYPLLFIHGESGWSPDLRLCDRNQSQNKKMTMNMYYSYLLHDRSNVYSLLLRGGRLLQQYIVDAYVCIEESRLDYYRMNQNVFRTEFLQGVHDAVQRGDTEGRDIGKRIVLPSSFIGGPRHMYKHYQDALAICRVHGNPQYFITFTCNVKWPKIERYMARFRSLKAQDRLDIIARVFQLKVKSMMNFLKTNKPFGDVAADLYTIEIKKRGLPHCHLLLWVTQPYRIKDASDVDNDISAEIPNLILEPQVYKIFTDLMIHGSCGIVKPDAPCMSSGSCSKNYPKEYQEVTSFDDSGYVHDRRQSTGFTVTKNCMKIDNGYVVPYNRVLSMHYMAHINVEYCGWSMLIKYLFKYISKGADRIRYTIKKSPSLTEDTHTADSPHVDEIRNFLDARFICPHEASWRILNFLIHDRNPPVQILVVHLENMQHITFKDNDQLDNIATKTFYRRTTLTEWLRNNEKDSSGRHLRYIDYLMEYRWDPSGKCWMRRASNKTPAIGRLIYIHPSSGEMFFLRMLLGHQRGCRSYACMRTVHGELCPTFRSACEKLGLLGDDREWSYTFDEAAGWATASELRSLFTQMLLYCEISNPVELWNQQWRKMADDGQRNRDIANVDDLRQYVLYELELLLRSGSSPSSLSEFGLPMPKSDLLQHLNNKLLMGEKNYDRQLLTSEHESSRACLDSRQRMIYEHVISSISSGKQVLAFVYGHGGTGKTFLWMTIISALRSQGSIVLAVTASGIASLLLPSGRTTHSRFKIPLDMTVDSICYIKKNTHLAQLLSETHLLFGMKHQ
ncbi:putative DNA helicase Pif1, helitron helicase-like domain-containing protein [Helianthus debilis subsp. tardiflorus]